LAEQPIESSIRNRSWGHPTPEMINAARSAIIADPAKEIYSIIRYRAEIMLGLKEVKDVFPYYIRRAVFLYFQAKLRSGKTMRELLRNYCEAEDQTPAQFPKMLAEFASECLAKKKRWETIRFRKFQCWLKYQELNK
jgi:hypothetical protein